MRHDQGDVVSLEDVPAPVVAERVAGGTFRVASAHVNPARAFWAEMNTSPHFDCGRQVEGVQHPLQQRCVLVLGVAPLERICGQGVLISDAVGRAAFARKHFHERRCPV
eukprot:2939994-Pyramimonas_sp.AAC.1